MSSLAAGLCSVTLRQLDVPTVVDIAVRAGLSTIEWGGDIHVPHGDIAAAEQARRLTTDAGLTCSSYGSYYGVRGDTDDPRPVLDSALALGARHVRIWCRMGVRPDAAPSDRDAVVASVATMCAAAAGEDVGVSLEFHPGTLTEAAASTLAVLDAVGAPNLSTYWQPDPALDTGAQLDELDRVRHRVSGLHVFAWTRDRARLPLADGADLWPKALSAVDAGPALLEFVRDDDPEQVVADAATLRRWLADA